LSLAYGGAYYKEVQQGAVIDIGVFDAGCHLHAKLTNLTLLRLVLLSQLPSKAQKKNPTIMQA